MALALEVDNLDNVPEHLKTEYVERDGRFFLALDGDIPDVSGFKNALETERERAKKAEKLAKEMESKYAGFDPEEYKLLKEKEAALEEEKLRQAGREKEIDEKKQKLRDEATQKILSEKDEVLKAAEFKAKRMEEKALDGFLSAGINGSGIHSFATDEAIADARKVFSLDENYEVVALDADGDPLFDDDGKSKLTIERYFKSEKLKARKPHWFETKGGGTGAYQTGASKSAKDLSHLPPIERLTAARKMAANKNKT